ncbi:hypothetical protein GlitD10_1232 [Gloeomargarita lithophora Alchichica-D10]|uniref:Uncharacterized protein n=1 Tax=Gloeomargarita lithophora Alchichica-D10 TaxID=1188229 RepID=A0A1J0ACA0_9CYAN|nr:hypothetical protein [Gloeomargarita lithophora]APB33552.1 hypothetical protein GlitD10_1232 [Gloeomargarita lithophora Alchichica-D10]
MEIQKIRTHIGEDGILQIQVPENLKNQNLEIIVIFHPISKREINSDHKTPEELGYSDHFIHHVLGSWEGEPLIRSEQPYYEYRNAREDREAS